MSHNIKKLIRVGLGRLKSKFFTWLSVATGRNFTVPAQVYWNMSNRCNFRCRMCPQWNRGTHEREEDYCRFEDMKRIIDQMKHLGIWNLGISGGEPLMRKELLFQVLKYANQQGIYTHFGSNGWLITEEVLREYDAIGGGHISLSIDGIGETHDAIRGVKGAYKKAVSVLEAYQKLRLKNVSIKVNTVMSDRNLDEILEVVELARRYGAAIFIQPFDDLSYDVKYEHNGRIDESFKLREENMKKAAAVVLNLLAVKKENKGLILNSARYLENIPEYFADKFKTRRPCLAAYKNLSIDPFGNVIPCGFLGPVGNIKWQTIMSVWNGRRMREARTRARSCRQNCMQGCFFELSVKEMMQEGAQYLWRRIKK